LTGFSGTTDLSATPGRPACPSRVSGWSSLTTSWGFPCCVRFPCVHAAATTPVQRLGVLFAHSPSRISLPRKGCRVGLHIVLFEACSAFTHVAACTLARSPMRDPLSEGFSHFVTSMTAPVASGWSICRVGLAPTGKRRLVTAHTRSGPLQQDRPSLCAAAASRILSTVNASMALRGGSPGSEAARANCLSRSLFCGVDFRVSDSGATLAQVPGRSRGRILGGLPLQLSVQLGPK
jgi:hypothetical protein